MTNTYTNVAVTAESTTAKWQANAGGIVAMIGSSSLLANCAALGDVTATGASYNSGNLCKAGGLSAAMPWLVENCYAAGNVTVTNASAANPAYAGALIGEQNGSVIVDSHYSTSAVVTLNGEEQENTPVGTTPTYNYNKITAEDDLTSAEFAALMNAGVSEEGIAATDEYLMSGRFSENLYTTANLAAARPASWLSWSVRDGAVLPGEAPAEEPVFAAGDGSKEDPYLIRTEAQLRAFAATTAGDEAENYEGKYVALDADITLTSDWTPIHAFAGTFDGRNHTITGLTIGSAAAPAALTSAGMFDYLGTGAVLRNVKLKDANVYAATNANYGRAYVGALVGGTATDGRNATIDHCSVDGGKIVSRVTGTAMFAYAGGLVGMASTGVVISNSWADVDVTADAANVEGMSGTAMAGGLLAGNGRYCAVINCAALGDVASSGKNMMETTSSYAGGLVGQAANLVENCYASGNVTLTNAIEATKPYAGLLVGQLSGAALTNCAVNSKAAGTVNGKTAALTAVGALTGSVIQEPAAYDTSSGVFAATMNATLSLSSMASATAWLTSEDVAFTQSELSALRPETYYGWVSASGRTVLGDAEYEEPADLDGLFASGAGTKEDPWIIGNLSQLLSFAAVFSETDFAGKYIALAADINLAGLSWTPIGHVAGGLMPFKGNFDGRGHTISNMTIGSADAPAVDSQPYKMDYGLFADVVSGSITNLNVADAKVYARSDVSLMAGALVGYAESSVVANCSATGIVQIVTTEDGSAWNEYSNYAGGLVGYVKRAEVANCWTDVAVDAYCKIANAEAGGITGINHFGTIVNCYALGPVAAETSRTVDDGGVAYVGGIAGCQGGIIAGCYSLCELNARSWTQYAGAITGLATAVSETYDSYFAENAVIRIESTTLDPVVGVGREVPAGYNEYGSYLSGSLISGLAALPAADMAGAALRDKLNAQFASYPVDPDEIETPLAKWILTDGVVTFGGETAAITYVPVERPEPEPDYSYRDGTYYGRDEGENVIVSITVKDGKIVSAAIVSPAGFDAANAGDILGSVVENQTVTDESTGTNDDKALKAALAVACNRALLGDSSPYGEADPSAIFAGGTGTEADPYLIETAAQLRAFAAAIGADEAFAGDFIALAADIDLSDQPWVPAGNAGAYPFSGIFDGQGHTISGMKIGTKSAPADYTAAGLFASADGAVIRNVAVTDAAVFTRRTDNNVATYAGLLVGVLDNSSGGGVLVDNCAVSGTVSTASNGQSYAGGIAGMSWHSVILNSGARVNVISESVYVTAYAGGIVGMTGFAVTANCYALGTVAGNAGVNSACVGGIAGMNGGAAVNCYSDVSLAAKNTTPDLGGITGRNTGIGVVNCGYFSAEKTMRSGNADKEPVAVGTNVTMFSTGVVKNTLGLTGAQLASEALRDQLNENYQCQEDEMEVRSDLADAISSYNILLRNVARMTVDPWILDGIVRVDGTPAVPEAPEIPDETPEPVTPVTPVTPGGAAGGSAATQPETEIIFSDVKPGSAAYEAIYWAVENGITSGKTATTFGPGDTCTRAQLLTMLYRAAGSPEVTGTHTFTDVPAGAYYESAVIWAVQQGITLGRTDTEFDPNATVTRAQAVTFLHRYAGKIPSGEHAFADVPDGAYYAAAVAWAAGEGIAVGFADGAFRPGNNCTRAQIVLMLYRYLVK